MNNKSVHIKGRKFNIYLDPYANEDKDLIKEPKIIITYLVNTNTDELVKEKVRFWKDITVNKGGERYYGELPLIFVRKDLIENSLLSMLDVANLLYFSLKKVDTLMFEEKYPHEMHRVVKQEKDIIKAYKQIAFKKKWLNYDIETFRMHETDVLIRRPHKDYVIFEEKTFEETALRFQIEATKRKQQTLNKGEMKENE